MSFTWPNIPFQGSEVTDFAAAYKELAESVLDEYFDFGGPTGLIAGIEGPYIEKLVVKELLQEGLLYACFIIQQRSGTTGPGTDFVLGNSPIDISDPDLEPAVLRLLGCKWGQEEDSYKNNIKCGNKPIEPPPDPNDDTCCTGSPTLMEGALLNIWASVNPQKPFAWVIIEAMKRYLSCNSTPLTADDLTDDQKQRLKAIAQKHLDAAREKGYNNYRGTTPVGWKMPIVTPLTDAYNMANLRGATSIYRVSFYGQGNSVHKLLGRAKVTADADDKVMCIKDDFDFDYGLIADRSDGSFPGDSITGYGFGPNMLDDNGNLHTTLQDVIDDWNPSAPADGRGSFGERDMVTNAALQNCPGGKGRGAPVPISICFD